MKKAIGLLLVLLTIIMFVSCSVDDLLSAGNAMGGFGQNLFGFEPNTEAAQQTATVSTSTINVDETGAVETEEREVEGATVTVAKIDFTKETNDQVASELIEKISQSTQSVATKKAVQEKFSEPVTTTNSTEVSNALKLQIQDLKATVLQGTVTTSDQSISDLLDQLEPPAVPTVGDLAAIQLFTSIVHQAKSVGAMEESADKQAAKVDLSKKAEQTLNVLNTMSQAGNINILGNIQGLSSLLGLMKSKAILPEAYSEYETIISQAIGQIVETMGIKDGTIDADCYKSWILNRQQYVNVANLQISKVYHEIDLGDLSKLSIINALNELSDYADNCEQTNTFNLQGALDYAIAFVFTQLDVMLKNNAFAGVENITLYELLNEFVSYNTTAIAAKNYSNLNFNYMLNGTCKMATVIEAVKDNYNVSSDVLTVAALGRTNVNELYNAYVKDLAVAINSISIMGADIGYGNVIKTKAIDKLVVLINDNIL